MTEYEVHDVHYKGAVDATRWGQEAELELERRLGALDANYTDI